MPVDLSAIDSGNANMKMYGDDIGRSSDIMSVDKMIGENSDVEITFVSSDESQTNYDLTGANPFDRDASVADILKENSWSIAIPLEEAVDTSGWEYESYGCYSNKEDLDKIIDKMGCPTSIYYTVIMKAWTATKVTQCIGRTLTIQFHSAWWKHIVITKSMT